MSFIVQLLGNAAGMIQNDLALKRQKADFTAQAQQSLREGEAAQAEVRHRANLIQGAGIARAAASGGEDRSTLDVLVDNAQQVGLDIARARYRGEMGWWAGMEGAKYARHAQIANWVTGVASSSGNVMQGLEKYGKYFQGGQSQTPIEGSREMFFSNARAEEKDDWSGAFGGSDTAYGGQYAGSGIV